MDITQDAGDYDMAQDEGDFDMAPDSPIDAETPIECAPEPREEFCLRNGKECGSVSALDNCNDARTANCGFCSGSKECVEGSCVCVPTPQTDLEFCAQRNKDCGQMTGLDSCGDERTAQCSSCTGAESCGAGSPGTPNVCGLAHVCVPASTAVFCQNLGKDCGIIEGVDNCGGSRMEDCGTCTSPETCGAASNQNVCGCVPTPCQAGVCGSVPNGCGQMMNCGCNGSEVCHESNCCQPTLCQPGQCGPVSDGCGGSKDCGGCASGTCIAGTCQCQPEDNVTYCTRIGAECGNVTGEDNCGVQRVANCGSCPNNNWTCVNHLCMNPG